MAHRDINMTMKILPQILGKHETFDIMPSFEQRG